MGPDRISIRKNEPRNPKQKTPQSAGFLLFFLETYLTASLSAFAARNFAVRLAAI
jgi:hypothetical protein